MQEKNRIARWVNGRGQGKSKVGGIMVSFPVLHAGSVLHPGTLPGVLLLFEFVQ